MVEQLLQTTTVCEWLKTVVLQPHANSGSGCVTAAAVQAVLGDAHSAWAPHATGLGVSTSRDRRFLCTDTKAAF